MKAYADTGFLVSVHFPDANSASAVKRMKRQALPLAWTWLHELEFKNAIRLKAFRKELDPKEILKVLNGQAADVSAGVYIPALPSPVDCAREAERLSAVFSPSLGTRSLDILHVAHALVLGIPEFLTFDKRQAALAKAAGLSVPAL
ncbi:type II toxin-antitoxin system VapC family toxin [Luteolibacter sp. Populi]|uniref:type II toxin-antitoxin system VapC family toxin n=1 Tax=Luteolibacter sp. Populi TaxID=3230487 RepID=UPI0034679D6C